VEAEPHDARGEDGFLSGHSAHQGLHCRHNIHPASHYYASLGNAVVEVDAIHILGHCFDHSLEEHRDIGEIAGVPHFRMNSDVGPHHKEESKRLVAGHRKAAVVQLRGRRRKNFGRKMVLVPGHCKIGAGECFEFESKRSGVEGVGYMKYGLCHWVDRRLEEPLQSNPPGGCYVKSNQNFLPVTTSQRTIILLRRKPTYRR